MKYLEKTFTIPYGSKEYRDNWDRIFDSVTEVACVGCATKYEKLYLPPMCIICGCKEFVDIIPAPKSESSD